MEAFPVPEPVTYGAALDPVIEAQHGVATREQLRGSGVGPAVVAAQLAARRWQEIGPSVIVLHNGPLTAEQRLHVAALHVAPHGCLAQLSALAVHGLTGFPPSRVAVVHPRATSLVRLPWLRIHESRRLRPGDVVVRRGLPVTDAARSTVDAVAWQRYPRFAYALPAAVVQQRICRPARIGEALRTAGRVRHSRHLRLGLDDIAGGAESMSEIDLAAVCRRHRLVAPIRQRVRHDGHGRRRYLDAEWDLEDGRLLLLEVDGAHHLDVAQWGADMKRSRRLAIADRDRSIVRCTAMEARLEGAELADDLVALGVRRLVTRSSSQSSTRR